MEPAATAPVQQMPVEEPVLLAADTAEVEVVAENPVEEEVVTAPSRKPAPPKVTEEAPKAAATDTVAAQKPERKPILRPKNPRRILEINPDTIKSNE